MSKVTYVFPHVPKCGGTTLLVQLRNSGLRLLEDYDSFQSLGLIDRNHIEVDHSEYDLIFGHFPIDRYVGDNIRYIALVRDPLDRAISNFVFHEKWGRLYPDDKSFYPEFGRKITKGEVDIIDYLSTAPDIKAVFKTFLRYWGRHRFCLVGDTGNYVDFARNLSNLLSIKIDGSVVERKADWYPTLTAQQTRVAKLLLHEEYYWYDRFMGTMQESEQASSF